MQCSRAYTLIEALVTVALIGVIVILAAPSFADFLQRQSVRADNQFALKAFNMARTQAMIIEEGATVVCWNNSGVNTAMSDGTTTFTLSPGELMVVEGTPAAFDDIITTGQVAADANVVFDNDADNCVGFDSQGRLAGSSALTFGMVFCKDAGDTEDAMRLEIIAGGRVAIKLNSDTTGLGSQSCS